jgi:hypothetical protein
MLDDGSTPVEADQIGQLTTGKVVAIFRWGVILDLNLSRSGLIDALYVDDDDNYVVDDVVHVYLDSFDVQKDKFIARPPHQVSLADRLREKGFDV